MTPPPILDPLPRPWWRPSYVLRADYTATWRARDGRTLRLTAPAGFRSDGSSEWLLVPLLGLLHALPWLAWLFGVGADGPHRAAALVHDYLYRNRDQIALIARPGFLVREDYVAYNRADADHAFLALALAAGMPRWRAWPRWAALRLVGWAWWWT